MNLIGTIIKRIVKLVEWSDEEHSLQIAQGATKAEILDAQTRLSIVLPSDYIELLEYANGVPALDFIEPSFLPIQEVDYLRKLDPEIIKIWRDTGNEEEADMLFRALLVGGYQEEQMFLLIPPKSSQERWTYWKFANWIPGEEEYDGLHEYFQTVLTFLEEEQ